MTLEQFAKMAQRFGLHMTTEEAADQFADLLATCSDAEAHGTKPADVIGYVFRAIAEGAKPLAALFVATAIAEEMSDRVGGAVPWRDA